MALLTKTIGALAALGLLAMGLAACARPPAAPVPDELPPLVLEDFFRGTTVGTGSFESRIAGVERGFTVTTRGRWDGRTLTLREDFVFDDGERDTKTWRFTKVGPGRYEGTREDVVGTADVRQDGGAVRLSYVADLAGADGGTTRVRFEDVIVRSGPEAALNRAVVSRFGFPVASVEVVFERR